MSQIYFSQLLNNEFLYFNSYQKQIIEYIQNTDSWSYPVCIIFGPPHSGKTTILDYSLKNKNYLIISNIDTFRNILEHIDSHNSDLVLVIDSLNSIKDLSIASLHLFWNEILHRNLRLILTLSISKEEFLYTNRDDIEDELELKSLESRFFTAISFTLTELSYENIQDIIIQRMSHENIFIHIKDVKYISYHIERTYLHIFSFLDTFIHEIFVRKKKASIFLIKEILSSMR